MQQDMDIMELAKIILQFAVVPIIAFMWMHYKMTQVHEKQIAVMQSQHTLVKENHDREFKEFRESIKTILLKLDEIQRDMQRK
jgi:hypothetical protein